MKKPLYNLILVAFIAMATAPLRLPSQEQEAVVPEHLKYLRDSYEEAYAAPFDTVLAACRAVIEGAGCRILSSNVRQGDAGRPRAVVQSELCVVVQNSDSVFKFIQAHSVKPPFIRGGVWASARVHYRFIIDDKGDGTVSVVSQLEFSGLESNITNKAYEFTSSGRLEFDAFEKIKQAVSK